MIKGGCGGANTKTGLHFEKRVDLADLLRGIPGYKIESKKGRSGEDVYFEENLAARIFKKTAFYKFLDEEGVNWKSILSKRLFPDNALIVIVRDTLFIIEVKFQQVAGSVDEKLQTCDFKRKQYAKLVKPIGLRAEYLYVLGDWFKERQECYKDTLDYILSVNCNYFFGEVPLKWFGLPDGGG